MLGQVYAESDCGCTSRGGPSDRVSPEALATAQATFDALLGSAPDGIAQRAQGRVRVSVQERGEDGEDRSIRVVDHKRWEGVGRGGRKGQVWVVFWDQVDLCVRMVIARHTSTLQERWRWKDHHPYIAFRRLPVDALTVWNG